MVSLVALCKLKVCQKNEELQKIQTRFNYNKYVCHWIRIVAIVSDSRTTVQQVMIHEKHIPRDNNMHIYHNRVMQKKSLSRVVFQP